LSVYNQGRKDEQIVNVTIRAFSFRETQLLLSQMLHDLISPFSSLSAGLDFAMEGKGQGEMEELIRRSKMQMKTQLMLFRLLFSYGEDVMEADLSVLHTYGKVAGIRFEGTFLGPNKVAIGLGFWMTQQVRDRSGSLLSFQGQEARLQTPALRLSSREDEILQNGLEALLPQESYASYLYHLLQEQHKQAVVKRTNGHLSVSLASCG
jgi:hypothetical protein